MPPRELLLRQGSSSSSVLLRRSHTKLQARFLVVSSSSGSDSDNTEDNNKVQSPEQSPLLWTPQPAFKQQLSWTTTTSKRYTSVFLVVTAAAAATAAVTLFPSAAQAVVVDTTTTVAAGTSWYASLAQTGFYQAFSLVFLSELGDKTFFIAGLLAMKTSRFISFIGSMSALAVMTMISVVIGQIFHVVPAGLADGIPIDDILAVLAFAFFGFKTLKEALEMDEGVSAMDEEFAEAEEAVAENQGAVMNKNSFAQIASIFALVFAAEFGDRSFLSTIALSAAQNPVSVAGGAIAAHAVATGIAVSGGAVVAKYLSEKVIGIIGGTLFLVFAVTTALGIF